MCMAPLGLQSSAKDAALPPEAKGFDIYYFLAKWQKSIERFSKTDVSGLNHTDPAYPAGASAPGTCLADTPVFRVT